MPVIGEADTNSYPLMTAINQARSRTKVAHLAAWLHATTRFTVSHVVRAERRRHGIVAVQSPPEPAAQQVGAQHDLVLAHTQRLGEHR